MFNSIADMENVAVAMPPVRSSVLRSAQSWTDIRQAGGSGPKKRRRTSTMSAVPNQATALPMVRISIEEEDEENVEIEESADSTGGNDERKYSKDSIGSFQNPRCASRSASLNVATGPDRKRKVL